MATYVDLLHPTLASLIMLVPMRPPGIGFWLLVLSVSSLVTTSSVAYQQSHHPRRETRAMIAYRYFVPLAAAAVLLAGSVGFMAGWSLAIYAPFLFACLMLVVGTQNAWNLLLGTHERPSTPMEDLRGRP